MNKQIHGIIFGIKQTELHKRKGDRRISKNCKMCRYSNCIYLVSLLCRDFSSSYRRVSSDEHLPVKFVSYSRILVFKDEDGPQNSERMRNGNLSSFNADNLKTLCSCSLLQLLFICCEEVVHPKPDPPNSSRGLLLEINGHMDGNVQARIIFLAVTFSSLLH